MSVASFKKETWEAALIREFAALSVADILTAKPSSVEGTKAHFNAVETAAVKPYTGNVAWDKISTAGVDVLFDTPLYWSGSIDDIDTAQLAGDVVSEFAYNEAIALAEAIDTNVLANAANKAGTKFTATVSSPEDAYDLIVDIGTKLDKKKVPHTNRYIVADPEFVNMLAKDSRVIYNGGAVLANGIVDGMSVNGFAVIKSIFAPAGVVIGMHKGAVAYGKQLDKTEALRLENSFADGIRGLVNFGRETIRPSAVAACTVTTTLAAE